APSAPGCGSARFTAIAVSTRQHYAAPVAKPGDTIMRRISAVLLALMVVLPASAGAVAAADVAILMPGSGGIHPGDFLVRNEGNFNRPSTRPPPPPSPATAAATVAAEAAAGHKVVIVGMSRGAGDTAQALAAGARPAGVVLVSGVYSRVI